MHTLLWKAMLPIKWDIPFPAPETPEFTFIDLFAGIGGFRIPMQELGGKCVFSSEFNYHAQRAYEYNFGEVPFGDITKLNLDSLTNNRSQVSELIFSETVSSPEWAKDKFDR